MFVFNSDGKENEEVFTPAVDKTELFNEDRDTWLAVLIFWGVVVAALLVIAALAIWYDPVALLALPVLFLVGLGLWVIVPHWVWHDARKI